MTKLVWGKVDERKYEIGVSHGVFYPEAGPGVVWNGLTNVSQSVIGGVRDSFYFDGIKYIDTIKGHDYQATLKAFAAPLEFGPCLGEKELVPGFTLTRQPRSRFGLSYRTRVNEDDYKLHLVYNATVSPNSQQYTSISENASAEVISWKIDAVPNVEAGYAPTAHLILDSTRTPYGLLQLLEQMIYGSDVLEPELPSVAEMMHYLNNVITEPLTEPI